MLVLYTQNTNKNCDKISVKSKNIYNINNKYLTNIFSNNSVKKYIINC